MYIFELEIKSNVVIAVFIKRIYILDIFSSSP